jgi:1-acyl-sn-glycerol-3-phosphate acyltransferase
MNGKEANIVNAPPVKKDICGDHPPRMPITPYDHAMKMTLGPLDYLARRFWNPVRDTELGASISSAVMDMMVPAYRIAFNYLYNLKVEGAENLPASGALLAANHSSWLDAQILAPSLARRAYYMAKAELLDMPLSGIFMEMAGGIPIERLCVDSAGLRKAIDLLKKGNLVVIFPEGTIPGEENLTRKDVEPDTGLLPGNEGMIMLAIKTKMPIVPVGIRGTGEALPPEVFPRMECVPSLWPHNISVHIGKPISFADYYGKKLSEEESDHLLKKVMVEIGQLAGKQTRHSVKTNSL